MSFRRPGKSGPFCHRGETIAVFRLRIIVILIQEHDVDNNGSGKNLISKVTGESEEDMQCHCSVLHNSAITSTSSRIQLRFVVEGMKPNQVTITIASTYATSQSWYNCKGYHHCSYQYHDRHDCCYHHQDITMHCSPGLQWLLDARQFSFCQHSLYWLHSC